MRVNTFSVLGATLLLGGACTITTKTDDTDATGGRSATTGGVQATGGDTAHTGGTAAAHTGGTSSEHQGGSVGEGGAAGGAEQTGGLGNAAGEAGSTGAEGGVGGETSVGSDPCSSTEATPNDDRNSATPYSLGTQFHACLQNADDVDYYEFSAPATSKGGYMNVSVTDVGSNGDIALEAYSVADNGRFHRASSNTEGGSVYFFFNAQPGARFRVAVSKYIDLKNPNPYLFQVTYKEVPDRNEPNDLRTSATPIEVGQAVDGYMFAGWKSSTGIPEEDWYDWFKLDLAEGDVNILLSIVAADNDAKIVLFNPLGTQIADSSSNTEGSSVELNYEIPSDGTYFVRVSPYIPPSATVGDTTTVPQYLQLPYTLTVTQ